MNERPFTPAWLRSDGFVGFSTISDIRTGRAKVSSLPGVYVVLREHLGPVEFLHQSPGGWFKGSDPTVPIGDLQAKSIDDSYVLYVGKADAGSTGKRGIRVRLDEYLRFGSGEAVGHRGGRYLWQIAHSADLVVCHKPHIHPSDEERRLLRLFVDEYEALPYANLRMG